MREVLIEFSFVQELVVAQLEKNQSSQTIFKVVIAEEIESIWRDIKIRLLAFFLT